MASLFDCIDRFEGMYGEDAWLSDGAYDYSIFNLREMLHDCEDLDRHDYAMTCDAIYRLDSDGYIESTPCYRLTGKRI